MNAIQTASLGFKQGIARQLTLMRESVGYSKAELARRMGVSRQFVSRMEGNVGNISADLLVEWASYCGYVYELTPVKVLKRSPIYVPNV